MRWWQIIILIIPVYVILGGLTAGMVYRFSPSSARRHDTRSSADGLTDVELSGLLWPLVWFWAVGWIPYAAIRRPRALRKAEQRIALEQRIREREQEAGLG